MKYDGRIENFNEARREKGGKVAWTNVEMINIKIDKYL
jgi:hypothetical protein